MLITRDRVKTKRKQSKQKRDKANCNCNYVDHVSTKTEDGKRVVSVGWKDSRKQASRMQKQEEKQI